MYKNYFDYQQCHFNMIFKAGGIGYEVDLSANTF